MNWFSSKAAFLRALRIWWDIMFAIMAVAVGIWVWQRRTPAGVQTNQRQGHGKGQTAFLWGVALAVLAAAALIALGLHDTNFGVRNLNGSQVQTLIRENRNKDLATWIFQYRSGEKLLMVKLRKAGTATTFGAAADDATLKLLKERGIGCPVCVEGRDFDIFGWEGKFLVLGICPLVLVVGISALLTSLFKGRSKPPLLPQPA